MSGSGGGKGFIDRFNGSEYLSLALCTTSFVQIKFGYNTDIGAIQEDIWSQGGTLSFLSAAETMNIVSSNTNDTNTDGTGARTIQVYGLDDNWNLVEETVTLNGDSNVETSNSYLRVYRMVVRTAGSTGTNAGNITATASSAGTVQAHIPIAENQTMQCIYSVPVGYTMFITDLHASTASADKGEIRLRVRPFGGVFETKYIIYVNAETVVATGKVFYKVPAKSDVKLTAVRTGGGNIQCSGMFSALLIADELLS